FSWGKGKAGLDFPPSPASRARHGCELQIELITQSQAVAQFFVGVVRAGVAQRLGGRHIQCVVATVTQSYPYARRFERLPFQALGIEPRLGVFLLEIGLPAFEPRPGLYGEKSIAFYAGSQAWVACSLAAAIAACITAAAK